MRTATAGIERLIRAARQRGERVLSEHDSKRVLAAYGVAVTREALVRTAAEAAAAARRIRYPVALKASLPGAAHKTERGLVALGLGGERALRAALGTLRARAGPGFHGEFHRYSSLFHVARALDAVGLPRGNRVSFLSPSGAFTVCLTDLCRAVGLEVPPLEPRTLARLQALAPSFIRMRNPVDIFGSVGLHGYERAYGDALDAVLADRRVDAAVVILMLTSETGVPAFDFLVERARRHPAKPVLVTFMGEHEHNVAAKAWLETRDVPCYMQVEEPFEVLAVLARCRARLRATAAAREG